MPIQNANKVLFVLFFILAQSYASHCLKGMSETGYQHRDLSLFSMTTNRGTDSRLIPLPTLEKNTAPHIPLSGLPNEDLENILKQTDRKTQIAFSSACKRFRGIAKRFIFQCLRIPLSELTDENLKRGLNEAQKSYQNTTTLTILLKYKPKLTDDHIRLLSHYFPSVTSLTIKSPYFSVCHSCITLNFTTLASSTFANKLNELALSANYITEGSLTKENLDRFENLKRLIINWKNSEDSSFTNLATSIFAQNLEELTLYNTGNFIGDAINFTTDNLHNFKKLKKLTIGSYYSNLFFALASSSLAEILEELNVRGAHSHSSDNHSDFTQENLSKLKKLKKLSLHGNCLYRGNDFDVLASSHLAAQLEELVLYENRFKPDTFTAKKLDKFKKLKKLALYSNFIGDDGLSVLASSLLAQILESLVLCNNKITKEGFLKINWNSFKGLRKLGISDNELNREGLAAIADSVVAKKLKTFYLFNFGECATADWESLQKTLNLKGRPNFSRRCFQVGYGIV